MGLVEDLDAVLDLMEDLEAPHMVVGGVALEALGVPRSTLDIDLQVRLREAPSNVAAYFHGWFVAERSRDDVFDQDVVILEGKATGVPVEMFLTSHWYTGQALDRRQRVESGLLSREIPVPTPEDFVLLKAAYMEASGRSEAKRNQDRLDIERVVEEHRGEGKDEAFDRAYVEEHAQELGVWDALRDALA